MNLYLVRHGETLSNRKKIYAGWSDEGLTWRGRKQAEKVAKRLVYRSISYIYTSPLRRTFQTAEIIGRYLNNQPISEDSFIELRLGAWEGLSEKEIARDYKEKWQIWNTRPQDLVLDGRETLHELLERVLAGIRKLKINHPHSSVVVVTHVAVIRVLLLYQNNFDFHKYRSIAVPNGEIFVMKNLQKYMTTLEKRSK